MDADTTRVDSQGGCSCQCTSAVVINSAESIAVHVTVVRCPLYAHLALYHCNKSFGIRKFVEIRRVKLLEVFSLFLLKCQLYGRQSFCLSFRLHERNESSKRLLANEAKEAAKRGHL